MAHILVRLSQGRQEAPLERQEADCRAYCERLGLPVEQVHREVQSAYKGRTRPVLEQALSAAARGDLVIWKLDRLTRRGVTGLGRILERLETDHITLHSVTESVDASTPNGRMLLSILAGIAEQSSADASLRIKRAFEEFAKQGKRHPGGKPPFGWGEGEQALVVEAAEYIVSGGSLRSLCNDWNARGIRTSSGGPWQSSPLSRTLRSESLIGVRVHHGERYKGDWEPVLTEAQFSAVGAALARNKANPRGGKGSLLKGLLVCGGCGGKMRSSGATEKSGRLRYSCVREPGKAGCGKVSMYRDLCDREVRTMVLTVWEEWEKASPVPVVDHTTAIAFARESLAQLTVDHYQTRLVGRELFLKNYQELTDRIAELEATEKVTIVAVPQTIEAKIRAAVHSVVVYPAGGSPIGLPGRVKVLWRMGWIAQRALSLEVTNG